MISGDGPAVSVIVPVYNRLKLLQTTVKSLRQQTLTDSEFLLVDDRSEHNVWEFLQGLPRQDGRFRIFRKPDSLPRGCQVSKNLGLRETNAKFVVFLDSDDLLAPDCLHERVEFLRTRPDVDIAVGRQAIFDESRNRHCWVNIPSFGGTDLDRFLCLACPLDVPWVNGGCIFRADSLRRWAIQYQSGFHWDDLTFHVECLLQGCHVEWMPRSPVPDAWYRLHAEEHYGTKLHSREGILNTAQMFNWLANRLRESNGLTADRRAVLCRSLFHTCILRAVDHGAFDVAESTCLSAKQHGILSASDLGTLRRFVRGRRILNSSGRLRYYWNQLHRSWLLKSLFAQSESTYGAMPVTAPEAFASLQELLHSPDCEH